MQSKTRAVVWEDGQQSSRDDELSNIGLILDEAITFKRIRQDLIRLLSTDCPDTGICAVLDISLELLEKFKPKVKRKIRRVEVKLEETPANDDLSKEVTFWEFAEQTTGDLDLLSWPSYYACLDCVKKEADCTPHAVDKSFNQSREGHASGRGIFFQRPELIRLLRLNFRRKYRPDVVKFATDNHLNLFKIDCKEIDRTTLLPPWVKGMPVQVRLIRFIFVTVQENLFSSVQKARRQSLQADADKVNKMLEVCNENVLLPPYK